MALMFGLKGELRLYAPDGQITISQGGRIVAVQGSKPRTNVRWYLDMIRRAREVIKTGKPRSDLVMKSSEKEGNVPWFKGMLLAAEDAVKRYRPERPVPEVRGGIPLRDGLTLHLKAK